MHTPNTQTVWPLTFRAYTRTLSNIFGKPYLELQSSRNGSHQLSEGAFIQNENKLLKQILQMIRHRQVETTDRTLFSVQAEIMCIHGDGEHALEFSQAIHQSLKQEKISIQAIQAK